MIRRLGTLVILVGLGLLAWSATVYLWKDPFTTAYTAWEQRRLEDDYERRVETWQRVERSTPRVAASPGPPDLRREARVYRRTSRSGDAVARLEIPRIGLDAVVVNGTDTDELRRGPGRHLETFMPGEHELVYVAGHRTTYGAPFSAIDELEAGDGVTLELPYGTFEYRVTPS